MRAQLSKRTPITLIDGHLRRLVLVGFKAVESLRLPPFDSFTTSVAIILSSWQTMME